MGSTIADVAARAGVSKATASRALSGNGYVAEATRQRVVQAVKDIGFVASPNAAGLVTGQTKTIGVVVPVISRWFFGMTLEGIEESLRDRGYDMALYNLRAGNRDRVFDFSLARKRADGVIMIGVEPTAGEAARLLRLGIPMINIGPPVAGIRSLTIDDLRAAGLATEHLLSLGHRSILYVGGVLADGEGTTVRSHRLAGHRQAMAAAGLGEAVRTIETEMSIPGGYTAGTLALSDAGARPSAIFAVCDEVAIGVLIAARRVGVRVPADLSVIGIDGHEYAEMFSLTTIEQNPREQGRAAVLDLLTAVGGEPFAAGVVDIPARLVVRASTAHATVRADAV